MTIPPPEPPVAAGSVVPPEPVPVVSPPSAVQDPVMPSQETIVIPAGFSPGQTGELTSDPPKRKRRLGVIVKIFLILVVLGGMGFAAWKLWGGMAGNGPITITYWGLWDDETIIQPLITEFETANPLLKIQYGKQSPKQYRERLVAAISRGEGPDVFRFHNTWVAMLRNELLPVPSTVIGVNDFAATFYPVINNDLVAGTRIYGIPLGIDGLGLYINESIFAAAGAMPPVSWEDVLTLVPKLTVKSDNGITTSAIALGETSNIEHWSDIVATMMMQNGARLTKPTGREAEEALLFYRKFSDPADPAYSWNENQDNSIVAFSNGRVAMIMAPSWRAFEIQKLNPALNFRISSIPQLPGNTVNWASYWVEGVSAKSRHPEAAWKFLQFLTSKESAVKLYTNASRSRLFGEPYARKDLAGTVAGDRYVDAYVKAAPTTQSFPLASNTNDNGINDQMIKYLEDAVNGLNNGGSPTQVLTTVDRGFTQILSRYGLVSAAVPTVAK